MKIIDGPQFSGLPKRAQKTTLFVVHWTGGTAARGGPLAEAQKVYDTLVSRQDSVQYVCTSDGTIVQLADVDAHCVHAGSAANDRSVGVEVVCPGSAGVDADPGRPLFRSQIHGAEVTYRGFLPAQVRAVAQLASAVLWRYGVAYVSSPVCLEDRMPQGFEGVVGHFQISSDKADPGPETMVQIRSAMVDSKIGAGLMAIGLGVGGFRVARGRFPLT